MITYLLNKSIDKQKYNTCIAEARQHKVYAYSWYLDCVAENWDVLVLNDYEAVMPLPWRKKYGIKYIFQPAWVQQLGIFSKNKLLDEQCSNFVQNIPNQFKLISYNVNDKVGFKSKNIEEKTNYVLPLKLNYKTLFRKFSKGRKSSVNQAVKNGILVKGVNESDAVINLFKTNRGLNLQISNQAYLELEKLVAKTQELGKFKIFCAYTNDNQLIGGAFFIISDDKITYLFSTINEEGRQLQAMSLVLNTVIKEYSESNFILDFEGSMIPSIAAFFRSFGTQKETYYHYKKWRLF